MTDLEKIEDMYPELEFYGVEVDSPHYHGHIEGKQVIINLLQPDYDWLRTALHEATHYKYDNCDLSDARSMKTMLAEKWACRESENEYRTMFG